MLLLRRVTVNTVVVRIDDVTVLAFKSGGLWVVPATAATFRQLGSVEERIAACS